MKYYKIEGDYYATRGMGYASEDIETVQFWADRFLKRHPESKLQIVEMEEEKPSFLTFLILY